MMIIMMIMIEMSQACDDDDDDYDDDRNEGALVMSAQIQFSDAFTDLAPHHDAHKQSTLRRC